jgi:vitamin B12 transporter
MLIKGSLTTYITFFIALSVSAEKASENNDSRIIADILPSLTVVGQKTANQRPVSTYETPISNLDFDPRVDLQSRNMAEAQGDISIRGGIFENTGVQVGSATLLDPQTGHYTTELPIAPEMLSEPQVLTGADNALRGFNSSVGTVSYKWSEITRGASLTVGGGDHSLNFQRFHQALTGTYENSNDWTWGAEIESSRSESDGTIPFGSHDFDRTSGRIQLSGKDSQTDLFAGYQEKNFRWPEMYTANKYLQSDEADFFKTRLFALNHRQNYSENSYLEASTYFRRNNDHFFFYWDQFPLAYRIPYLSNHETKSYSLAVSGYHEIKENYGLNYNIQATGDSIDSDTLNQGYFHSRKYLKLSILPEHKFSLNPHEIITLKVGGSFDDTNRDKPRFSPIAEINWNKKRGGFNSDKAYLSYAQTTQVIGYGGIAGKLATASSPPLFASDPDLKREISRNLELGYSINRGSFKFRSAVFNRWDRNLVDWVYKITTPNARSPKHVEIETFGLEIITSKKWDNFEAISSFAFLKKIEDYKDLTIDGSYYALNYPEQRVTLGIIWNPIDILEFRMDNEWRKQRENFMRKEDGSPNSATYTHIAASYYPSQIDDLEVFIAFDKPWDEQFQDIPGTPGRGDQFSLGATYRW